MLRVIHIGNALPISYPIHPSSEFEPGMIAQITLLGNDVVAAVSDGTAPLGIIDDSRTNSFSRPQIDEITHIEVDVADIDLDENNFKINTRDVIGFLQFPNIVEGTFISNISLSLNPVNAVVTIPAGTRLNYASGSDDNLNGFKVVSSYVYRIANKPGDDTTLGSNRITIYYQRGFYATDQFDTRKIYPLNATLYVGLDGKLTVQQPTADHPGVAIVTGPPSAVEGTLEFLWL